MERQRDAISAKRKAAPTPPEPPPEPRWRYDFIKWFAKQQTKRGVRTTIADLIALADSNDPFYTGQPSHREQGEWFAAMWKKLYDGKTGLHLRRIHYSLDALKYPKPDGTPYRRDEDWPKLLAWSARARILGLVDADAFIDRRNPEPHPLSWERGDNTEPMVDVEPQIAWILPSLSFASTEDWRITDPEVTGYDADDYEDRAYYIEVWVEKSTADDILIPLTEELGVRLVTSEGFQSISGAIQLCKRARAKARPTRIFYISDFDKAGGGMPTAVARQLEFWRQQYAPGADIKLTQIALTAAQVTEYDLPSTLIDDIPTVELDALEALRPGELGKIVRRAIEPYLDDAIDQELEVAEAQANLITREAWARLMWFHERELRVLEERVAAVADKYKQEAADLNARLQVDLAEFKEPLAQLQADITQAGSEFDPDLPDRPTQAVTEHADEANWLFDSARAYLKQLRYYKAAQKRL
jgi:hypothetical protein